MHHMIEYVIDQKEKKDTDRVMKEYERVTKRDTERFNQLFFL